MIRDTVKRLLPAIGKSKPMSICPYVVQLYIIHDAIQLEIKKAYMVEESMMKHNVKPDKEEQLASLEDFERKSLDVEEIAQLLA